MDIKNNKEIIETFLKERPYLRDDDFKLMANIWITESKNMIDCVTTFDFLRNFSEGKFSSPESIRRCRQKLQELNPYLEGEKRKKRKFKQQQKVKVQLVEMKEEYNTCSSCGYPIGSIFCTKECK